MNKRHDDGDVLHELQDEIAELEDDRPPHGGPVQQVVAAVAVILFGAYGVAMSLSYGLGRLTAPGPGLWPFVVSALITVLGVALLVVGRRLTDTEVFTRASIQPLVGVLSFLALAVLLPVVGFEIPSLLLCVVWLRFLGGESWRSTIVVSVAAVVAFYLLFVVALSIPLPRLI